MKKAAILGLSFRENIRQHDAIYTAAVAVAVAVAESESVRQFARGLYYAAKLGRPFYRSIGAPPVEQEGVSTATINETIDATVFERWRRNPGCRPANLSA